MATLMDYLTYGKPYPHSENDLREGFLPILGTMRRDQLDALYVRVAVRYDADGKEIERPDLEYCRYLGDDIEYIMLYEKLAQVKMCIKYPNLRDNIHTNLGIVSPIAKSLSLKLLPSYQMRDCLVDVLRIELLKAKCDQRKRFWGYVDKNGVKKQYFKDPATFTKNMISEFILVGEPEKIEYGLKLLQSWWDSGDEECKVGLREWLNRQTERDIKLYKSRNQYLMPRSEYIKLKMRKVNGLGILRRAKELGMIGSSLDINKYLHIWTPELKELLIPLDQGAKGIKEASSSSSEFQASQGLLQKSPTDAFMRDFLRKFQADASQRLHLRQQAEAQRFLQKAQADRNFKRTTSSNKSRGPRNMNGEANLTNRFAGLDVQD